MLLSVSVSKWLPLFSGPADSVGEGNSSEVVIFGALLLMGIGALMGRVRTVNAFCQLNWPILLFVTYCAMSAMWSDFPGVAVKRWAKSLGDFTAVMIILTDHNRLHALKSFLNRIFFLLVPISILLIKYVPELGVMYKFAEGRAVSVGVTNDKNMLGVVALLGGLGALWRITGWYRQTRAARRQGAVVAQGVILLMCLWLFRAANSMTSLACFALTGGVLVMTSYSTVNRNRLLVHALVASVLFAAASSLFLNTGGELVKTLGRDSTLTGRTQIWEEVLSLTGNPVVGTGFESFWLGKRLEVIWSKHWWHPNEAHNGYIEVYLNLGMVGLFLLGTATLIAYSNVLRLLQSSDRELARLKLAFLVTGLIYSFTEAGFRMLSPIWIAFVFSLSLLPRSRAWQSNPVLEAAPAAPPGHPWKQIQPGVPISC
jgi:O-antigen ligase